MYPEENWELVQEVLWNVNQISFTEQVSLQVMNALEWFNNLSPLDKTLLSIWVAAIILPLGFLAVYFWEQVKEKWFWWAINEFEQNYPNPHAERLIEHIKRQKQSWE